MRIYLLLAHAVFLIAPCLGHISLNDDHHKRFTVQFKSDSVEEDRERFLQYLHKHNVIHDIRIRFNYSDVFNGMSFEVMPGQQQQLSAASIGPRPKDMSTLNFINETLSKCPYVHRYWPGKRYSRPAAIKKQQFLDINYEENADALANYFNSSDVLAVDSGKANLHLAHALTTVDLAKKAGWTGKGIKIGILDTGIDYTHPALGGCFGEGCLVRYGQDLVGDMYNGPNKILRPDNDPLDQCDGHGTHIAGIIAANDTLKGFEGVAPEVTIGAWRIFGCQGDTEDDIILAAVDMAVKAGMNIINLSVGGGLSSWQEDSMAVALSNIAKKNITVIVAQGNEGSDGFARTPSPAIGEHLISVGSVDNKERYGSAIQTMDEQGHVLESFGYAMLQGQGLAMQNVLLPYTVFTKNTNLTDRLVILPYNKDSNIIEDVTSIQKSGALGILLFSDTINKQIDIDPLLDTLEVPENNILIPIALLSYLDGSALSKSSTHLDVKLRLTSAMIKVKTAGMPSDFSTWGPDPELHFKPDISAVGGFLYSTFPVNLGAYATLSGTSMATPYISGCIALLMQATQYQLNATSTIQRLINYAKPLHQRDGFIENPIKQGSGLVQVYESILGDHLVTPVHIALNDTAHFSNTTCLTISNQSNKPKLYKLQYVPSVSIEGYNFSESAVPQLIPRYHPEHFANVTFQQSSLTVQPHQSSNVEVNVIQPISEIEHLIYGGYLKITCNDTQSTSHIPLFGALGYQRDLPILDTMTGYPFIGDGGGNRVSNNIYNFSIPNSALHLYTRVGSPTAEMRYHVINTTTSRVVGELVVEHNYYIARNDHAIGSFDYALNWRGGMIAHPTDDILTNVPVGSYTIRVSVLKIYGNPQVQDDWEVWISPPFTVIG